MPSEAYHACICGPSDGGKTTRAREHHATFDGVSIWVNHNGESGIAGHRAIGPKAIATGIGKFEEWRDVRINLQSDSALEGLELALRVARDIWDTAGVPVQIILDEAHNAFGDSYDGNISDHPMMWAINEGRSHGIKMVPVTQNPQNMPYKKMDSIKYWVWVGEWSTPMSGFLTYYGFKDKIDGERFHVTVFDRQSEVVHKTTTDEKYA